jgi:hypothetical protein
VSLGIIVFVSGGTSVGEKDRVGECSGFEV